MKKFCLLILFVAASAVIAFAQTLGAENWKTITPPGQEFTMDVPASMLDGLNYNANDQNVNPSRYYIAEVSGSYFYIFSDPAEKPAQYEKVLKFANLQTENVSFPATEFQSRKLIFNDKDGYREEILAVRTHDRAYVFQTFSSPATPDVARFFATIKFDHPLTDMGRKPRRNGKIGTRRLAPTVIMPGIGGSGVGNGGIGNGNGTGSPEPAIKSSQKADVRILSRVNAQFTDWARFYQIQGRIRIRITFLANGILGAVVPLNGLPCGLTGAALEAARQIKFTPAAKDGQSYTASKVVEYSFAIY